VFWLGFRRKNISYIRQERKYGKSAWTFQKKINYLLDSVFAFTDLPIKILIKVGMMGILIAMILGIAVGLGRAIGIINVPGIHHDGDSDNVFWRTQSIQSGIGRIICMENI
jgi:hypothetical protein